MPLEALGLLCLLEKVGKEDGDMEAFARHGLQQNGYVDPRDPSRLTEAGAARLRDLRAWREGGTPPTPD